MVNIPRKEWWCGCDPDIKFRDEEHFKKHMQTDHKLVFDELTKRYLV